MRVREALTASYVERVQEVIWTQLREKAGVIRDDPATWKTEWVGINKEMLDRAARPEITPRLQNAVNQLPGEGTWKPLKTLGGLLMTMPGQYTGPWEVPARLWHTDNDPHMYRSNLSELMLFTFYAMVAPQGGGTPVLAGSPSLFEKYYADKEAQGTEEFPPFDNWHPYLAELTGRAPRTRTALDWLEKPEIVHGVRTQVVELTGEPGEAILCHPAMYHAVAPNTLASPRIMRRTNFRRKR